MAFKEWITFAPTRRFPFGRWFRVFTLIYLFVIFAGLLAGSLLTVAWETIAVSRDDFNATDSFWGHYFDQYTGNGKGRCKPIEVRLNDEFYTTNGIFRWTVAEINYGNGSTPRHNSKLAEYSGQFLDNSMIESVAFQHYYSTYVTNVQIWARYYPTGDDSYLSLMTSFTLGDVMDARPAIDSGVSENAAKAQSLFMGLTAHPLQLLDLYLVTDPLNNTQRMKSKAEHTSFFMQPSAYGFEDSKLCTSEPPRGACENQEVYFLQAGRVRLVQQDGTAHLKTPREVMTNQWDHGFNYVLYSAAKYDLGHWWRSNAMSNATAWPLYGITLDNEYYPTLPPAPPARFHTPYLCTFRVLKAPFNLVFSVVTSMSTLIVALWRLYVLIWKLIGPKLDKTYGDYINPYDKLDDDFELNKKAYANVARGG